MLGVTIKNMLKYKGLTLCLIIGFVLSIGIASTVPIYTKSMLNSFLSTLFMKDVDKNLPPAMITVSKVKNINAAFKDVYNDYESFKNNFSTVVKKVPVPILAEKAIISFDHINYTYSKNGQHYASYDNQICSITDFEKHVNIIKGRLPESVVSKDNILEVIVDSGTFNNFKLELNGLYEITNIYEENAPKMKVVGVFGFKSKDDPYWSDKDTNFYCRFIASEKGFFDFYKNNEKYTSLIGGMTTRVLYDYKKIVSDNADSVNKSTTLIVDTYKNRTTGIAECTLTDNMRDYLKKQYLYSTVMWMFLIPVLFIVMYYIVMISGFIIDGDKEQIAVLKSRGAGRFEILSMYFYEGILISAIGLAAGPILGLFFCKVISYSDGFMKFSSRQSIKVTFNSDAIVYSVITVVILLSTLLISVFIASRKSIVEVRQSKNRNTTIKFINKNMDFIILGVSLYGYYLYGINKNTVILAGLNTDKAPVDPLLYLVSTLFIIGTGMILIRIYSYIIKFIFAVGKGRYVTSLYLSIINVMRHHLKKTSIMLFIAVTVAIGIFNIIIAKNINTSYGNTVKYNMGADIRMKGVWQTEIDPKFPGKDDFGRTFHTYKGPSYSEYSKIDGVESYTKVLNIPNGKDILSDKTVLNTTILGIIPYEFGKIAWFDSSLLKIHWYYYLNALTAKQNLVLISRGLSNAASMEKGDQISYKVDGGLTIHGEVYDVIDYWPGVENLQEQNLIVGNLNHIFNGMPVYPYEIWMKKKPGVSDKIIYDSIKRENITLTEFKNISDEIYNARNDIFLKGTNAILTLGFTSIAAITIIGFVLYWMLSLKSRTLQLGIYRSLGLSAGSVSKMLIIEQLFTLGSSMVIGVIGGNITAYLFMPLIKDLWYSNKYVVPAKNLHYYSEYLKFGAALLGIFILSLIVLKRYISKMKINQALKLGEE